jgi:tRNA A37 methylthiotransferase MiaB
VKKLPVIQSTNQQKPESQASPSYEQQTQAYSTWGGKLLQHTDVLHAIQAKKEFRPITVQLAPTEACDSNCPFCSVSWRAVDKKIPFAVIEKGLREFRALGAKSIELTGGRTLSS